MKINNVKLLKFLEAIDNNLLGLIMQLIALYKAIVARFPVEAQHCPKVLRYLNNSIQGQLMQLHPEFVQNICESRMRQHPQSRRKDLFEDNSVVGVQL
jgi:hypothetical protein